MILAGLALVAVSEVSGPNDADLGAIRRGEDHVILKSRPAVVGDVGIHNGKVGVLFQGLDVVVSVVKLVVAEAHHIVAR